MKSINRIFIALLGSVLSIAPSIVFADSTAQTLPFTQNWTTTTLVTANDNWSTTPGIEGFLGQDITTATGADPQTLLTSSAVANDLDVIANQTNPNGLAAGGVAEFDGIANPSVALQGSGTADASNLIITLNTTGFTNINVAYNLRDLDGSADNSVQPVALQFRVGNSGNFTNVPAGFVADATSGPSLATLVTPVSTALPATANNQALVQVRVITANAAGNDEWVGVDDINITGTPIALPGSLQFSSPTYSVAENGSSATITVNRTGGSSGTVTVNYATSNGTATSGSDYTPSSGTLTFADGVISQSFSVPVIDDFVSEPSETVNLTLSNPTGGATLGAPSTAFLTITNVPKPGSLQFSAATYNIAENGVNATITATRTLGSDGSVTVNYATSDGTAIAGTDYTSSSGTLTFADGVLSQTFSVSITNEGLYETNETVNLTLSGPTGGATLGAPSTAELTITNDDTRPVMNIAPTSSVLEGNAGTSLHTITINLSAAAGTTLTSNWNTVATATNPATAGSDYVANSGTITFVPGDTSETISITINGDTTVESDETFGVDFLSLAGRNAEPNAPNGGPSHTVTILNDDAVTPNLTINDVTLAEGNAGTTTFAFTVNLSSPAPAGGVTFDITTANGSATQPSDYVLQTLTGQTIAAGNLTYTFNVSVNGDTLNEPAETFNVNVTNVTGANVTDGQGLGTINNDDALPSLSINDVTVTEGNGGTVNAVFTVALNTASGQTVTVNYAAADNTATQPADYTGVSGILTFTPGTLTQTITVPVVGETALEANETFFVNLSGATNATIADNQGIGTITNDDAPVATIAVSPTSVLENSGSPLVYTITLTPAPLAATTVNFTLGSGSATSGTDYPTPAFTASFAIGVGTATVNIIPTGDTNLEADETVILELTAGTGYTIGAAPGNSATGTITNDDFSANLSFTSFTVNPTSVFGGSNLTYTLVVNNAGPDPATNVTMSFPLPAGLNFVSANGPGWTCTTPNVTCTIANLPVGSSTITVVAGVPLTAPPGTTYNGTATLTSNTPDPNTANNASNAVAAVGAAPVFPIPTLGEWARLLMMLGLFGFAALALRQRAETR